MFSCWIDSTRCVANGDGTRPGGFYRDATAGLAGGRIGQSRPDAHGGFLLSIIEANPVGPVDRMNAGLSADTAQHGPQNTFMQKGVVQAHHCIRPRPLAKRAPPHLPSFPVPAAGPGQCKYPPPP